MNTFKAIYWLDSLMYVYIGRDPLDYVKVSLGSAFLLLSCHHH